MADPTEKEYRELVEQLFNKTIELEDKLKKVPDSEKDEIYFELKKTYHELKKAYRWMIDIDPLINKHYQLAFERTYCSEIYYHRKYLYTHRGELDFNEFLELVYLIYDFFYFRKFEVSINFRRNLVNLVDAFDGEMEMIINGLERAIETIYNDSEFKKDKFEYHNTLGDLHFQIYLLVEEYADYAKEFMNEHLNKAIRNYLFAEQSQKIEKEYRVVNYLPILTKYWNEHGILHFLELKNKLKVLRKEFPEKM